MRISQPPLFANARFFLVCFAALAVALPMAIISIAKLLLFFCALVVIASAWLRRSPTKASLPDSASPMILLALAAMALSYLWSTGSTDEALIAFAKHGKLVLIPVFLLLIRSRREALVALAFFVGGQMFLLSSTWLMFLGISIPWAMSKEAGISYAVFSSYLDQSIMTAVLAALCWHMRDYVPTRYRSFLGLTLSGLALACVFFVFQGRTGHLVAITLITLAIAWEIPKRFRMSVVLIPLVLLVVLAASSSKVHNGLTEISSSIESFNKSGDISSSSSIRLNLWHRSLQAIAENPWKGTGVGSWSQEFNRQEARHAPATFVKITGNPHQEYLLWGVELGVPGIALFCAVLLALFRDSLRMEQPTRRAMQSVLAALAVACLFNSSLYDALIGDFFCVAVALVLALSMHPTPPGGPVAAPRPGV